MVSSLNFMIPLILKEYKPSAHTLHPLWGATTLGGDRILNSERTQRVKVNQH